MPSSRNGANLPDSAAIAATAAVCSVVGGGGANRASGTGAILRWIVSTRLRRRRLAAAARQSGHCASSVANSAGPLRKVSSRRALALPDFAVASLAFADKANARSPATGNARGERHHGAHATATTERNTHARAARDCVRVDSRGCQIVEKLWQRNWNRDAHHEVTQRIHAALLAWISVKIMACVKIV